MFSFLVWCIYGIFTGSIAKALVPGDENFGLIKTMALGIIGSYVGGAILYILGTYQAVSPAGIIMGIAGSVVSLLLYNKLQK